MMPRKILPAKPMNELTRASTIHPAIDAINAAAKEGTLPGL